MRFIDGFLDVKTPKTRMNKGFLNGGGGGLRLKPTRKTGFLTTNQNNKFLVQDAQSLNQNDRIFTSKLFAFRYKENRRIGKNAYFDTC